MLKYIVIVTEYETSHDITVRKMLERAKKLNIKLNLGKCVCKQREISYLGMIFIESGMKLDQKKSEAIRQFKNPKNKSEL